MSKRVSACSVKNTGHMTQENSKNSFFKNLKYDLPASIVVFLVALPLCLGIAVASGVDAVTGVIAGIVGGIVVASISGSRLGVSGPAAGLAAIVFSYVGQYNYEIFLVGVILAGVFQVIFGYIKAGVIADYFPSNVIKGMLAAIGILLILKQIPHAFGDDKDPVGDDAYQQVDGKNTFTEILDALSDPQWGAFIIVVVSMGILLLWKTKAISSNKVLKLIPAPLLVVIFGVSANSLFKSGLPNLALAPEHLVSVPVSDNLVHFFNGLSRPNFSILWKVDETVEGWHSLGDQWSAVIIMAFTIALVASLESLLSVEATDKLDPNRGVTPTNRELLAQGTGNIVSGLLGGLPITQVIVRSSANVNAGGKSKFSAIIHGGFLLVSVLLLPVYLNYIPLSCLAAILIMTGYKLANINLIKSMWKLGFRQFFPFALTIAVILAKDLLVGITVGLIVSIFFILQDNRKKEPFDVRVKRLKDNPEGYKYQVLITFHEEVTYLNKTLILLSLHDIPENSEVLVDASNTEYISQDVMDAIQEFQNSNANERNIKLNYKSKEIVQYDIDDSVIEKAVSKHQSS